MKGDARPSRLVGAANAYELREHPPYRIEIIQHFDFLFGYRRSRVEREIWTDVVSRHFLNTLTASDFQVRV